MASFLQARTRCGQWLIRVEDIDPPREVAGSAGRIIDDLRRLGMRPDGDILFQSSSQDRHAAAWQQLIDDGSAYWCGCSRKDLVSGAPYPGTCSHGLPPGCEARSVRARTDGKTIKFLDLVQGACAEKLDLSCGDFIIRRADGLPAYQLAVVVDDNAQGITEVVRGADLLDSTARQIHLQQLLGVPRPGYMHVPVVTDQRGAKLAKRLDSDPVHALAPERVVARALKFLGQDPPPALRLEEVWTWALKHWNIEAIPRSEKR